MLNKEEMATTIESKELGKEIKNNEIINTSNAKIKGNYYEVISKMREVIDDDNKYKMSFLEKQQLKEVKIKKQVNKVDEAIKVIEETNLFDMFGINSELEERFKLEIEVPYKVISFLSLSIEEAYYKIKELKDEYVDENIQAETYNDDEYIVTDVVIMSRTEAVIRFFKDKSRYCLCISLGQEKKEKNDYLKLSVIDFYCIVFKCPKKVAIEELIRYLEIDVLDTHDLRERYNNNLRFIKNEFENYKNLFSLVSKQLNVLEEINKIGLEELHNHKIVSNKACIYCSYGYLAERVKKDKSTITAYINAFCALGLLKKEQGDVDEDISKSNRNRTNLFNIPIFNYQIMKEANENAMKVKEQGVTIAKFTYNNCIKIFGKAKADEVIKDYATKRRVK